MSITVNDLSIENSLILRFVPYFNGRRLVISDNNGWFPVIGWCPHNNIGAGQCDDCGLVLEEDDDNDLD